MEKQQNTVHHAQGVIMGGPWQVRHVPQTGLDPQLVVNTALAALQSVDNTMSHFKPQSDLMRFNRAPFGEWFAAPADLVTVMQTAAEIHRWSGGALNIALGREINAWGFGAAPVPSEKPTMTAIAPPAYQWRHNPPALKRFNDATFNLAALAKGFAVELAGQKLLALGVENFLVEAAGEVVAHGHRPNGRGWQIGLELPIPQQCLIYGQIALHNMAVATSGGYRKFHAIAGETVIHALDPQSGLPVNSDLLAVSVLEKSCMRADALATALFVMGAARGSDFAAQHGVAALFLVRVAEGICEIRSQTWMDYLAATGQDERPPVE